MEVLKMERILEFHYRLPRTCPFWGLQSKQLKFSPCTHVHKFLMKKQFLPHTQMAEGNGEAYNAA